MMPASSLTLTAEVHAKLRDHLFPGDGLEAAAILMCARVPGARQRLLAGDALLVPHADCVRHVDQLRWPGAAIEQAIDVAEVDDLSLLLVHSHPGGYFAFSDLDDQSDRMTMPGLFQALGRLHGSAIMVPDGAMLARTYGTDMRAQSLDFVSVAGHDFERWWCDGSFSPRPMAFTSETRDELKRLTACVVGASGTGSIVVEQLARLGFGRIIIIDFDRVELRNLNRILNSSLRDAELGELKVEVLSRAIHNFRGPGVAIPMPSSILNRRAVVQASQADFLFSCVDSQEGRQIADLIASSFLLPLFDVGVTIPTRQAKGRLAIGDVFARIDYVRPGGPTLSDRSVYTQGGLRAEYLRRVDPAGHAQEVAAGYIPGAHEEAPSVITLNMRAASDLVSDFLARLYPFRHDANERFARRTISLAAGEEEVFSEDEFPHGPNHWLGRGASEPLLGLPALAPGEAEKEG